MQRIRETTSLNGIDEFLDRFIQVKGAQLWWCHVWLCIRWNHEMKLVVAATAQIITSFGAWSADCGFLMFFSRWKKQILGRSRLTTV
jgi:hypothetical protein